MNHRFQFLWLSLFVLGSAGCVQAGSSFLPLLLTGLLVTFGSIACKSDDCSGSLITSCSEDGEVVENCCPAGVACNYLPYTQCPDGSCIQTLDPVGQPGLCPGTDAGSSDTVEPTDTSCDGDWITSCSEGEIVQDCCPADMACNYLPYEMCEDGSCVIETDGETCPGEVTDTGSAVDEGSSKDTGSAADPGTSWDKGSAADSGTINDPGTTVDAGCDGEWMTACNDNTGEVVTACCPAGVACNYLPYVVCDDGKCVSDMMGDPKCPDEQPTDAISTPTDDGCTGTWNDYCNLETNTVAQGCCPVGAICNYIPFGLCDDGSCVGFDKECAPAQ